MGRHVEITFSERNMLSVLAKLRKEGYSRPQIYDVAAEKLGIGRDSLVKKKNRLRRRYTRSLDFGKDYREWRRRIGDGIL